MSALSESFWNFCLRTWSDKPLSERLINASITEHADVVLLLFSVWSKQQHHSFNLEGIQRIEELTATYRPLVEAYRSLRRQSKSVVVDPLYQAQKHLELKAEQCYANELCGCISADRSSALNFEAIVLTTQELALARHLTQVIDSERLKP